MALTISDLCSLSEVVFYVEPFRFGTLCIRVFTIRYNNLFIWYARVSEILRLGRSLVSISNSRTLTISKIYNLRPPMLRTLRIL